ncbi:transglutaminase domain-containing protein [Siphonobacter curvatus]|uniref:Transglutaminase-like domain-containing protein n=1 Tax=Siphonobacter curvatus TaxID=2094562 RepID=A0A2S7IES3_9BACT|nr:transglutaminase domain-containing protein [Siphonobacter curvatus]PQA53406.1 hypothetical protein C5O19_24480 [Siphonobacter curvatus]
MKPVITFFYIIIIFLFTFYIESNIISSNKDNFLIKNTTILSYYLNKKDTLGYKSAQFLLEQIYLKNVIKLNSENIDPYYLINNIDLSLKISREKILNKSITFKNFCEYILPHRIAHETLINWRSICLNKYKIQSLDNDILNIFNINKSLKSRFKYSTPDYSAQNLNWVELSNNFKGDCWTMAYASLYPLRSIGIPVTIDYVPRWGNVDGGSHAWNVYITDKISLPFMGCESDSFNFKPLKVYREDRIPVKVYRLNYSSDSSNNITTSLLYKSLPIQNSIDVTDLYVSTKDIVIKDKPKSTNHYLYLFTFNNGKWKPSIISKKTNNKFFFDKLPTDVVFIPGILKEDKSYYSYYPFYIDKKTKKLITLKIECNSLQNIKINYTQSKIVDEQLVYSIPNISGDTFFDTMDSVHANLKRSKPKVNNVYSLYYWNKGWIFHSSSKLNNKHFFKNVPSNTLYKIESDSSPGSHRFFTYANGNQLWW